MGHEIEHQADRDRFVIEVEGHTAHLDYRRDGDRFTIEHTIVPEALGGRGLGGALVQAALDHVVAQGDTLVPQCPYARSWLGKHPDQAARATIDWGEG